LRRRLAAKLREKATIRQTRVSKLLYCLLRS
jgi:hypothetical protein